MLLLFFLWQMHSIFPVCLRNFILIFVILFKYFSGMVVFFCDHIFLPFFSHFFVVVFCVSMFFWCFGWCERSCSVLRKTQLEFNMHLKMIYTLVDWFRGIENDVHPYWTNINDDICMRLVSASGYERIEEKEKKTFWSEKNSGSRIARERIM